jgi:hypothetical protein
MLENSNDKIKNISYVLKEIFTETLNNKHSFTLFF